MKRGSLDKAEKVRDEVQKDQRSLESFYKSKVSGQYSLSQDLARLSPASCYLFAATRLAGTGSPLAAKFNGAREHFQRSMDTYRLWARAGRIDSFYSHSKSLTTLPPRVQTNALMGYTEAMYWGIRCFDAHPESLVVLPLEDKDDSNRHQDIISWFFDRNLDRKTFAVILINSEGYIRDGWYDRSKRHGRDHTWDADATAATYVGDEFWSVELELRWDPKYHPPPVPGDVSGLDLPRFFRAIEWSQPFRGYRGVDAPGYLVYTVVACQSPENV